MLNIEIIDNKITPAVIFANKTYPDTNLWTPNILDGMLRFFDGTEAIFIIDTIYSLLYKKKPSRYTQSKLFELAIKHLSKMKIKSLWYDIKCSSLDFLSFCFKEKLLDDDIKSNYMKIFCQSIQKFKNVFTISEFKKHLFPISASQKNMLNEYNQTQADNIFLIRNETEYFNYCRNYYVFQGITPKHLKEILNKFNFFIKSDNSVIIAYTFYETRNLLLKARNNGLLDKQNINNIIIKIIYLWKNDYYLKCINNMQIFTSEFSITPNQSLHYNEQCLANPLLLINNCVPQNKFKLLNDMVNISKTAVISTICQKIIISSNFPYVPNIETFGEGGNIEDYLLEIVQHIINKNGYKLLNVFSKNQFLYNLYDLYKKNTIFNFSLFNKWNELYSKVKKIIQDEYILIDISDNNIHLAHITQLFPIIENKIRELGMLFNILPFAEKQNDDFDNLKEPTTILKSIFESIYSETDELFIVNDLLFVYMVLYDKNYLNIRNECIHGNDYNKSDNLNFAFNCVLLCLYIVCNRIIKIKETLQD